ncbi:DUF3842 family protein [Clostridiaceae bacterium 35-E11]
MIIGVIDAQGAGIGKTVIAKLRKEIYSDIHIIALGTNEFATANMIKAGADVGITGEKKIIEFCKYHRMDCIIGPIGIIYSGGIQGEITTVISEAVFHTTCAKYLIPLKKHGIYIPGTRNLKIKDAIEEIVYDIRKKCKDDIKNE